MNNLDECRKNIDEIDTLIIELFEKRMDEIKKIVDYKIKNNLPILDSSREEMMLQKNLLKIKNNEYKPYYKDVLNGFLKSSKDFQKDILNNK